MNVLHEFFDAIAPVYPEKIAVIEPGKGDIGYR